jgi:hypothetical protein
MIPLIDAIEVIVVRIARTSAVAAKGVIKSEAAPKPMKSAVETSAKESAGEIQPCSAESTSTKPAESARPLRSGLRNPGLFDRAISEHNTAILLNSEFAPAHANRGFAYEGNGDRSRIRRF